MNRSMQLHYTMVRSIFISPHTSTILITEDETVNFLLLEELVSEINVKLIHTSDSCEAIEICKSNPDRFDFNGFKNAWDGWF